MRAPTTTQLARMQAHADESMWDTCEVWEYNGDIADNYGASHKHYALRIPASICGFKGTSQAEVMQGTQVIMADAEIRLPITTTLTNLDRIRITHRHGAALASALTYEIISQLRRGPSAVVMLLRLVTDGSEINL